MKEMLQGLNEQQRQAVEQTEGPVLVLAGAGSGKTKALTHRIAYLIREKKVSTFNILAVTFTNKASQEMGDRVAKLLATPHESTPLRSSNFAKATLDESSYEGQANMGTKLQNYENGNTGSKEIAAPPTRGMAPACRQAWRNDPTSPAESVGLRGANNEESLPPTTYQLQPIRLPWLGTFHSICVRILRREAEYIGYSRNFTIYDTSDQKSIVKRVMKDLKIDPKIYNPQAVQYFISGAKNELIDYNEYKKYINSPMERIVAQVYEGYQKYLRQANAFDFDDLIMKCVELFQSNPDVLARYQDLFKYILIDEYQDTNQAQYMWVKLLAKKHKNIMVVGDDYQAIYGWRGANFRNILNFERDWLGAKVIKLEQNYRSTDTILTAANEVIKFNKNKTDKSLWTEMGAGCPITVYRALNEKDEAEFVGLETASLAKNQKSKIKNQKVGSLSEAGFDWTKFAVLYRTNAQSRALEEAFMRMNIPYKVIGGVRFYERKEIKDMISYLRVILNPCDFESLTRAVGAPTRGIGEKSLEQIREISKSEFLNPKQILNSKISKKFIEFLEMMAEIRQKATEMKLEELIAHIAIKTSYKEYLLDGTPEGEGRWENVQELMTVAAQAEETRDLDLDEVGLSQLEIFLEKVALIQDTDNLAAGSNAVTLMTLHSAKGLEFETVFIVGMEEGIFPHSRSIMDQSEMEEERRLCYVGITRAKKRLYLLYAMERNIYGRFSSNAESRFISHIPEGLTDRI